ncbi:MULTISPECIES: hypothetical protein [Mycobacterium]|nr:MULTISPECIES: hypothetical protein [Mycobacterium]UQB90483.1 hypothetical protein KN252_14345 [Mycobacterium intracellulare]WSE44266.1 hypothetical protein QGN30_13585 [Mycobacterium sp. 3-98]
MTDVKASAPESLTILSVFRQLDDDLIHELSGIALELISSGTAKAYELAGRFVAIAPAGSTAPLPERTHYLGMFEKVVPQEHWNRDEIPEYDETEIVVGDGSLDNRIKFAAFVMRELLAVSKE